MHADGHKKFSKLFLEHTQLSKVIRQIAQGLLTSRWDGVFLDMLCMGRVTAIYKNSTAAIRPITIPSMWRKLTGSWTAQSWAGVLKPHVGDRQYGVGCSNGCIMMAHDINNDLHEHRDWAVAIFGHFYLHSTMVKRSSLIEALQEVDPRLMASSTALDRPL